MITKTTAANFDEFYAPRFAEITEALHEAGLLSAGESINSIESYFTHLTDIGSLQTYNGEPGKYLVVPFDEPYFEIDANTRIINIPDHFKKYGVGVTGDNTAEMLVFKVDRYFDHRDFNTTKVAINWSFTPKTTRTPIVGVPQQGFAMDCELEEGYIVFGFIITRDMALDNNGNLSSGTLNFSVTFYDPEGNDEYRYSWNTIPASVSINEGLVLEDPSSVKDISRNIIARLVDSSYTPKGILPLANPKWLTGDTIVDPVTNEQIYLGLPNKVDFHMNADGTEDEELILTAQAYSDASATMKYSWFMGFNENDILTARPLDSYAESTDFTVTLDGEPVEGKPYYINVKKLLGNDRATAFDDTSKVILEVENGVAAITNDNHLMEATAYYEHAEGTNYMVRVVDNETLLSLFNDALPVYELGTSFSVKQAGTYSVRAQAVKEIHETSGNIPVEEPEDDGSVLKIKANKVPADNLSSEAAKTNQNAFDLLQEGNSVVLTGKLDSLVAYHGAPGDRKWLAVDLATNVNDITSLTWDNSQLTQADADEAMNSVGLEAGHIVFWADAEALENSPRIIKIGKFGGEEVELTISFADSALTNVLKTLINENLAENIEQDNVVKVQSNVLNSNICVVPGAAKPEVTLNVETNLDENSYDIVNEAMAAGYVFIDNTTPPKIIATVTSSTEPLGAVALEALSDDEVAQPLTVEAIEGNIKSEDNPEGKYEFALLNGDEEAGLLPGQAEVSNGLTAEGIYRVRAINRRNHSYAVSEPSEVIKTSFVAPKINAVSVTTIDGSATITLLDSGVSPVTDNATGKSIPVQVRLNTQYPTRKFYLKDNSTENNIFVNTPEEEKPVTAYILEEVMEDANDPTGYSRLPADQDQSADKVVAYNVIPNETTGQLEVVVDDSGLYRIRVENMYHGTRRVGYTEIFEVARF